MKHSSSRKIALVALAITIGFTMLLTPVPPTDAADHGDAPTANLDRSADIGDLYAFLDPNDNSRLVILGTAQGFINPGEAINFGAFDENVRYRFDLETTGDASEDLFFDVRFSKRTAAAAPQTATIITPFGDTFVAPTTPGSFAETPPVPVLTTDSATGVTFFAGLVDDPFFFDIPAFGRFIASVNAGAPNPALFSRGRDSFAGFNNLGIAMSFPISLLRLQPQPNNQGGTEIGLAFRTQRRTNQILGRDGQISGFGRFLNLDRFGIPAVNIVFIPFARKDEYNASSPLDDSRGKFANDIIASAVKLGTSAANIGVLASIAVVRGDFLRLRTSVANSGPGGGNSSGAGFPNGRRLQDDVIDIELSIITNGALTTGDSVNGNELAFRSSFPFFAPSHTPRPPGTTDDLTRH